MARTTTVPEPIQDELMAEKASTPEPYENEEEMTVMADVPESKEDVEEEMAVKVPSPEPKKKKKIRKMVEKKKKGAEQRRKRRDEPAPRSSSSIDDSLKLTKVIENVIEDISKSFDPMIVKPEDPDCDAPKSPYSLQRIWCVTIHIPSCNILYLLNIQA